MKRLRVIVLLLLVVGAYFAVEKVFTLLWGGWKQNRDKNAVIKQDLGWDIRDISRCPVDVIEEGLRMLSTKIEDFRKIKAQLNEQKRHAQDVLLLERKERDDLEKKLDSLKKIYGDSDAQYPMSLDGVSFKTKDKLIAHYAELVRRYEIIKDGEDLNSRVLDEISRIELVNSQNMFDAEKSLYKLKKAYEYAKIDRLGVQCSDNQTWMGRFTHKAVIVLEYEQKKYISR